MAIVVQKFGGTSVATPQGWQALAAQVRAALEEGKEPVVVVSAMGRKPAPYATDTLLSLVADYPHWTSSRERDMLMACGEIISTVVVSHYLRSVGLTAKAFDGAGAGIKVQGEYGQASIVAIDPSQLREWVTQGGIPVVAGFQGINERGEIVTLGRGGSDTTAVALGVALKAERVDIFTDVEGVMTADPRYVPQAQILKSLTHQEIGEMANEGAKVLHPRAVEISQAHRVPLRVRSTFSTNPGTEVTTPDPHHPIKDRAPAKERLVVGVVSVPGYCMVVLDFQGASDLHTRRLDVFEQLAQASLSLDMINVTEHRIAFLVRQEDLDLAKKLLEKFGYSFAMRFGCAKVSVVGQAMRGQPGVMARICQALSRAGVELYYSTDSHITISAVIPERYLRVASQALHREFGLEDKSL